MTKQTQTSGKQLLDVRTECVYDGPETKAFRVNIKEGCFLVVDYKNRFGSEPDTEVFWDRYIEPVANHTTEFKAADKVVSEFLKRKPKA